MFFCCHTNVGYLVCPRNRYGKTPISIQRNISIQNTLFTDTTIALKVYSITHFSKTSNIEFSVSVDDTLCRLFVLDMIKGAGDAAPYQQ